MIFFAFSSPGGWNSALSRAAIERLSTTCCDLRALSLTGCKGLTGESLLTIIQNCKGLMKLDLSAVSVRPHRSRLRFFILLFI